MRISVGAGHNVYINGLFDPGAVCYPYAEADITKQTVSELIPLLRSQGHEVLDVTPYNERFSNKKEHHILRCNRADAFKSDIYIDVHINAGGGEGAEIWVYKSGNKASKYAEKILNNMVKHMNLKSRGVKANSNYWSVSLGKSPAMIVEGAFIDTKSDMKKLTPKKYAESIARCFGEVKKKPVEEKKSDELYRVQVGAFRDRKNAESMLKELEKAEFKGFISKSDIEVKKEPGKLISKPSSEYYEKYGLKIIETDPDNIYIAALPGKTLRQFGVYGINGTWQNTREAHLARSIWGLAGNGNKAIGSNSYQNSPNGHKRGTIIYYEDGTIEVKRINNLKEIGKPFKWCIGGGMLLPDYNPILEKIAQDILRKTAHTGIGYKENRVYLIVHPKCLLKTFKDYIERLNLNGAIFLDGGGSTQMNYKGNKGIHSSRKLSHRVFLKKA